MLKREFRILLVDDDPLQVKLATAALVASGFGVPTVVGTAADATTQAPLHDLVLLDIQLPDGNGLDVLRMLRSHSTRPAVVIVTGHGAEVIAAEALRLGADDYLSKDAGFMELLPTVVERVRRSIALRDTLESTERDVVEAERRTAVGEMTVALHHEVNNPLMAALTEASLLAAEPDLSQSMRRGLEVIKESLERIRVAVKRAGESDAARNVDYLAGSIKMADLGGDALMRGVRGRVMVVAKDASLRRVIAVLLRRIGFEPESVDALEEAASRLMNGPPPSLVVLAGFGRGDALNGSIVLRGDRPWKVVVLAVPGSVDPRECSCDLMMPLPFDPATFGAQMMEVVGG